MPLVGGSYRSVAGLLATKLGVKVTWLVIVMESPRWSVAVMVNAKQSVAVRAAQDIVIVEVCKVAAFPVNFRTLGEKVAVTPGGRLPAVSVTRSNPEPPRPTV